MSNQSVADKVVTVVSSGGPVRALVVNGNELALYNGPYYGRVNSGQWATISPLFRLRLTGTGTCTVDARNSLGTVTEAVESFSADGSTNQIEYPYAGDDAVAVRLNTTGSCVAEII